MSKLDNIGYYDKKTGEELEKEIFESIQDEMKRNYISKLFHLYKNFPQTMSFKEVSDLRNIMNKSKLRYQKDKSKVNLRYNDGFYMVALNTEDDLKELSLDTNGFLHLLGFNINKSGVVIYKNNKPLKSFEKLRDYLDISDRLWRRIKKEIDEKDIVRKAVIKNEVLLLLNPKYSATAYEVTEFKFVAYNDYFKVTLSSIDYLYLSRQFEIDV